MAWVGFDIFLLGQLARTDPSASPSRKTPLVTSAGDTSRTALLRRGVALEWATLGCNVVGIVTRADAVINTRSVALAGFGLDT
ncbi:hypothetical protein AV521_36950 [Streptomyces sp. IMTB 2501]|uniref:hypothetical protein n=1 Tax=Streptomyces sp. IMTB 2501 TaxID=1776340 RepID=UPI00096CCD0F|nr:hypothetical protein [Streptomyces sp. IMTB 2501]OLZ64111.1 hypothetical protein AV521_36950 [Streptomyces sp. IMTB 2501]